jgi:PKD repeat protein
MKKITSILMLTLITGWFASFNTAQAQPACQAGFVYVIGSTTPNGTQVSLYDSSWANGTITNWNWTFNNGTVSTLQNPTTTLQPGFNLVCLTITSIFNGFSCTSTSCDTIFIQGGGLPCDPNFTYFNNPGGVTFTSSGTSNISWTWNFGDGTSSNLQNPVHAYNVNGTYNVCLTVTDVNGQSCTSCQPVVFNSGVGGCQANYNATNPQGTTWSFADNSTGTGIFTSYYWDFGDGNSATGPNATHTYATGGMYFACLTILDSLQNCFDTYCDTVFVQGGGTGCNATFAYQNAPS